MKLLRETLSGRDHHVRTLISSSAQGYYEPNLDRELGEDEEAGAGWMGQFCKTWEAEALLWRDLGVRVVINRTGLVLASHGGALAMMLPALRKGFANNFGGGRQIRRPSGRRGEIDLIRFADKHHTEVTSAFERRRWRPPSRHRPHPRAPLQGIGVLRGAAGTREACRYHRSGRASGAGDRRRFTPA